MVANSRYIALTLERAKTVQWLKSLAGGTLVALLLLLNAMAASPSLHEFFHADASHADHQCGVTLFAHGQVESSVVDVAAIIPLAPAEFFPLISVSIFNSAAAILPPGRAPPVAPIAS